MSVFDTAAPGALTHNLVMYRGGGGQVGGMMGAGKSGMGFFGETLGGNPGRAAVTVFDECELNKYSYVLNREIHTKNPTARSCAQMLKFHIFRDEPELYVDGRRIDMDQSFRDLYHYHWVPFLKDWFDEAWCKGAPAVRLRPADAKMGLNDPVPQIVNDLGLYTYTTYKDLQTDRQGFRVLRNVSRTTGKQLNNPRPDPIVFVMSGYADSDPDTKGNLTTPLTSLQSHENFMRMLQECAASAESLRCTPFVFTEVTPQSAGQASNNVGQRSYFAYARA